MAGADDLSEGLPSLFFPLLLGVGRFFLAPFAVLRVSVARASSLARFSGALAVFFCSGVLPSRALVGASCLSLLGHSVLPWRCRSCAGYLRPVSFSCVAGAPLSPICHTGLSIAPGFSRCVVTLGFWSGRFLPLRPFRAPGGSALPFSAFFAAVSAPVALGRGYLAVIFGGIMRVPAS